MSGEGIAKWGLVRAKHLQLTLTPLWYIMHAWGQQQIIKYQIPHGMLTKAHPKHNQPHRQSDFFFWPTRERATIWGSICDGCRLKLSAKWGQAANLVGPKHTQRQARRYPQEFHLLIRFLHGEKIRFVFRLRKQEGRLALPSRSWYTLSA